MTVKWILRVLFTLMVFVGIGIEYNRHFKGHLYSIEENEKITSDSGFWRKIPITFRRKIRVSLETNGGECSLLMLNETEHQLLINERKFPMLTDETKYKVDGKITIEVGPWDPGNVYVHLYTGADSVDVNLMVEVLNRD